MLHYLKKSFALNIILILLTVLVGYGSWGMLRRAAGLYYEQKAAQKRIGELSAKKGDLEARIEELTTPEAREREAKERLNLKRAGEEVIVVVPEKKSDTSQEPESFWGRLRKIFILP